MKGLIKKVRENKKGFTLAELLVVVAIVGILVAISIPVFTAQLSKARKATNQANMRAAKAAAVAQYLTDSADSASQIDYDYDISTGEASVVTTRKLLQKQLLKMLMEKKSTICLVYQLSRVKMEQHLRIKMKSMVRLLNCMLEKNQISVHK